MTDTPLAEFLLSPCALALAAVFGALLGSFLNVVIERLPRGESLLRPGSHCLACGAPVRFYDNVPVLSYLWLRGRCRACRAPFSARYLGVELIGLVLGLGVYLHAVRGGAGPPVARLAQFTVELGFACVLVALGFIDLRTLIVPHRVTLPAIAIGLSAVIALGRLPWYEPVIGAAAGFLLFWLIGEIYYRLRGQEGLGGGDGTLLALIGGVLGWKALPMVLLLASVQGLCVALPLRAVGFRFRARFPYAGITDQPAAGEGEEASLGSPRDDAAAAAEAAVADDDLPEHPVPFGPFLALGALEVLLFGPVLEAAAADALDRLLLLL